MLNKSLTLAVLLAASTSASAAPIIQMGKDVTFSYNDATLFGTGIVSSLSNNIFFLPTSFSATSTNGSPGAVLVDETLNITVDVKKTSNFVIDGFRLAEAGDYLLTGDKSTVSAGGQLQVVSSAKTCGIFLLPCNDSAFFSAGALTTTDALTKWTAGTAIDLDDTVGWGSDTSVVAQIQNELTATTSDNGELATIQKTFGAVGVGLVVLPEVPLPAAAWLFGSAILGLGALKRKKA